MFALIIVLFTGMKVVTAQATKFAFSLKRWLLYSLGWAGMDPKVFFSRSGLSEQAKPLLRSGSKNLLLGLSGLMLLSYATHSYPLSSSASGFWGVSLLLLISLSLVLHFGLLNINAGLLNLWGYPAYKLFRAPLKSKSLGEFWGKRWNIAFTEMTSITVYKPLNRATDPKTAPFIAFLLSGLLHEVALTLSVQKKYGGPIFYFMLHGVLVVAERAFFRNQKPERLWCLFWLVVPLPLLFHKAVVFWKLLDWF